MGDSGYRFAFSQTPGQAMIVRGKVIVLHAGKKPDDLSQSGFEPLVAFGRPTAEMLARTLLVPRTDPSPGREMGGTGKAAHVDTNFPHNASGSFGLNRRNTHQQAHRFLVRSQIVLDLKEQFSQRLFQKVNV